MTGRRSHTGPPLSTGQGNASILDRMTATIEIPDELYQKIEARSAREGRPVRAVTIELFERWLQEEQQASARSARQKWLENWFQLADEIMKDAPPGPTAREILEEGRNRLERR